MLSLEFWIERTAKMLEQKTIEIRHHIEALLDAYPDLRDDEFLRASMIEGSLPFAELLTEIHRMISDSASLRDGTQPRIDDLMARRSRFQRRIDFGRDLLIKLLDTADLRKVELAEMTLVLKKGQPKVLGDPDPNLLPDRLCKVTRTLDRKKIREALEAGEEVSGCTLSNIEPSLMIRVK